jgi:hypothetical protein
MVDAPLPESVLQSGEHPFLLRSGNLFQLPSIDQW